MTISKPVYQAMGMVRQILPMWVGLVVVTSCIGGVFLGVEAVYSVVLGSLFSMVGFFQLVHDQYYIINHHTRRRVFLGLLFRLGIYAIPMIIGLRFPSYFKFWIILICLFKSQIIYIVHELVTNYKKYKRRMAENG